MTLDLMTVLSLILGFLIKVSIYSFVYFNPVSLRGQRSYRSSVRNLEFYRTLLIYGVIKDLTKEDIENKLL